MSTPSPQPVSARPQPGISVQHLVHQLERVETLAAIARTDLALLRLAGEPASAREQEFLGRLTVQTLGGGAAGCCSLAAQLSAPGRRRRGQPGWPDSSENRWRQHQLGGRVGTGHSVPQAGPASSDQLDRSERQPHRNREPCHRGRRLTGPHGSPNASPAHPVGRANDRWWAIQAGCWTMTFPSGQEEPEEFDPRGRIGDSHLLAGRGADFCPPTGHSAGERAGSATADHILGCPRRAD